jgi:IS30 family transposase
LNWSPEQIAGWLTRAHPDDESYRVSHETIYRSLFVQARGVLKKELLGYLRSKRTIRRSKRADPNGDRRGHLSVYSQAHLNKVARQLNERPRETLQFETPAERFNACVASTG